MGLLDKFKDKADDAKKLAGDHAEQISDGIDKGADFVDDKTGGKHTDKIDKAADKAKDALGKLD
ncbi:MAG TPA: antitoxin [Acidimicrobiales bacterium]|nr:antitoxin [Acidimicrobiales bacterium]